MRGGDGEGERGEKRGTGGVRGGRARGEEKEVVLIHQVPTICASEQLGAVGF